MKRNEDKPFIIAASYDTETSNIKQYDENGKLQGNETRAICILYIFNDLRLKDLSKYEPDKDDKILFLRHENEAIEFIEELIEWGKKANVVPIVCAYNLMFDLQTLMYELNTLYTMKILAQSSTNVYTLDLLDENDKPILRFWDTYHLEMRGLSAMGETAGLQKAIGEWDYDLIRTSNTPLTDEELFYAKRDVQVIPAYLKYLLNANEWLRQSLLGSRVLTKTSLVRQMAQKQIGNIRIKKRNGKEITLLRMFETLCKQELPNDYASYAIRKACFRGGFTFTSGKFASRVVKNVASLDVTSMHHAFINGRYIPIKFYDYGKEALKSCMENVLNTDLDYVLKEYYKPFNCAFHAEFQFVNIRLKKDSCFDKWQIALIPMGKFRTVIPYGADYGLDERARMAEEIIREKGYHDKCVNPTFAFGKLYKADSCCLFLTELELWCLNQVYDWDECEPIRGECTIKWTKPPDYVTLQSNMLFETKNDAKVIHKNYQTGVPYKYEIPNTIPDGIRKTLETGECDSGFFESYYNSTVKGMFNGIYGTMAQDVFKPDYAAEEGELYVQRETAVNAENYEEKKPRRCKVLYTYGMRIVGGSRMHLVIAMILLYERFGDKIDVTGGDTDSLKIRTDLDVNDEMLLDALKPLHDAVQIAIDSTQIRVRKLFPNIASELTHIGKFECESCGGYERWKYHMESWNKARVSLSQNLIPHVTCAGLSRPIGKYHIESFIKDLITYDIEVETVLPLILGYNVFVTHAICHALEHRKPKAIDVFDTNVTDYLGNTDHVIQHEAIALYETGRMLGDTTKKTNYDNVKYLRDNNREVNTEEIWLQIENKKVQIVNMEGIIYEAEQTI